MASAGPGGPSFTQATTVGIGADGGGLGGGAVTTGAIAWGPTSVVTFTRHPIGVCTQEPIATECQPAGDWKRIRTRSAV